MKSSHFFFQNDYYNYLFAHVFFHSQCFLLQFRVSFQCRPLFPHQVMLRRINIIMLEWIWLLLVCDDSAILLVQPRLSMWGSNTHCQRLMAEMMCENGAAAIILLMIIPQTRFVTHWRVKERGQTSFFSPQWPTNYSKMNYRGTNLVVSSQKWPF